MNKGMLLALLLIIAGLTHIQAQNTRFFDSGVVTFERKTNTHALLKREASQQSDAFAQTMLEQVLKNTPQFSVENFTLTFGQGVSKFQYLDNGQRDQNAMMLLASTSKANVTYHDVQKDSTISQRDLFGDLLLISDKRTPIKWKITEEMRDIAGYTCRRANGLMLDSVYVVAFFTDQITLPVGPELSGGLPGMILGLAIPYEHISYFATKVEDKSVSAKDLAPPTKGKKTQWADLESMIAKSFGRGAHQDMVRKFLRSLML
jgi:GLPGLI family protein